MLTIEQPSVALRKQCHCHPIPPQPPFLNQNQWLCSSPMVVTLWIYGKKSIYPVIEVTEPISSTSPMHHLQVGLCFATSFSAYPCLVCYLCLVHLWRPNFQPIYHKGHRPTMGEFPRISQCHWNKLSIPSPNPRPMERQTWIQTLPSLPQRKGGLGYRTASTYSTHACNSQRPMI